MKENKTLILSILLILIVIITLALIGYFIKTKYLNTYEGITNQDDSTMIVVTLKSDSNNITEEDLKDKSSIGNGIPSELEYNIRSFSSDNSKVDPGIIQFQENLPKTINLSSINTTVSREELLKENSKIDLQKTNSFIAIYPKTTKNFPSNFQMKLENNVTKNKNIFNLWGDNDINKSLARPKGNANTIIGPHNLESYLCKEDYEFTYNQITFGVNCNDITINKSLVMNNMDLGNKVINVIQSGDIFDNNGKKIGSVSKSDIQSNISMETIAINIENANEITGMLIYIGYPTEV